jgi:hypothetical protein
VSQPQTAAFPGLTKIASHGSVARPCLVAQCACFPGLAGEATTAGLIEPP